MLKAYALRLHRWIALVAAAPLLVVIVTGLVLSFEPIAQRAPLPSGVPALTAERIGELLARHDPRGAASGLSIRPYEAAMTISGVGPEGWLDIDLRSGGAIPETAAYGLSDLFYYARQLHEHVMLDLGWLVTASTIAMIAIALIGLFMGWPRLANTLGGWHAVSAWATLPLLVLSPLTGLALAFGVTFTAPPRGPAVERPTIREAVAMIAAKHDLADLTSLRGRGGRLLARVYVDGKLTGIAVTKEGLVATPTNWPRALHEGNWHWFWGSLANIVVSVVLLGLLVTGVVIWARRRLRLRRRRATTRLAPAE